MGRKRANETLFDRLVHEAEVNIVRMAIKVCSGNVSKAASWLEMSPQNLNAMVKRWGLREYVRDIRAGAKDGPVAEE